MNLKEHPSAATFAEMKAVIEAPGFDLLTHYKQDFYVHDREILEMQWSPDMQYLWIVREMGTHLYPVGLCERIAEEANAVLGMKHDKRYCYLIQNGKVAQIEMGQAEQLMKRLDYSVINGFVCKHTDTVLAEVKVDTHWVTGQLKGAVTFTSDRPYERLTQRDVIALQRIAVGLVIKKTQSIFTPVTQIHFNEVDMLDPQVNKSATVCDCETEACV